jgi:membrane associated rhomboid family serine protease
MIKIIHSQLPLLDEIKRSFQGGSTLVRIIYINLAIWIIANIVEIFFFLSNAHDSYMKFLLLLALPADLSSLASKPWTLLTYMFLHKNFLHILFNMLWLFWFGKIFLQYLDEKKLVGIYLLGGLSGGILYIATYNVFPVFAAQLAESHAMGASAAVLAIVIATAVYRPDFQLYLMFVGPVKIIYIALVGFIVTSLFDFSINTGGKIAHIGGALFGYLYIWRYKKGKDLTKGLNSFLSWLLGLFKPRPKIKVSHRRSETDMDYNKRKKEEQAEIDRILDKIARAGYDSLNSKEKELLFKQSKK